MSLKFWGKKDGVKSKALPGPKEIPHPVARHLVVEKGHDPDWVWGLQSVLLPKEGEKHVFLVRVFNANDASMKSINVKNYHSLDEHPQLVIFEGWLNKDTMQVGGGSPTQIRPRAA